MLQLIAGTTYCPEGFLDERISGCTDDPAVIVEHNLDRHVLEHCFHAAFVEEGLHECRIFHLWDNFRSNAATDKDASSGHEVQRAVSRLCPKYADKNRQGLIAN